MDEWENVCKPTVCPYDDSTEKICEINHDVINMDESIFEQKQIFLTELDSVILPVLPLDTIVTPISNQVFILSMSFINVSRYSFLVQLIDFFESIDVHYSVKKKLILQVYTIVVTYINHRSLNKPDIFSWIDKDCPCLLDELYQLTPSKFKRPFYKKVYLYMLALCRSK